MATETLAVRLLLDANQYKREAGQAASATGKISNSASKTGTATNKLEGQMRGLAATAKFAIAGAATAAVGQFARASIREATSLEESLNAVQKTFGDFAPAITEMGENAANQFGLAQSEFNAFAVQFSNFAESIAEGGGQSVPGVIEDLTGRIADFASVMEIEVPEAAEKFQSGLAGQVEPLRRFGIDVSAAATQQKALELGLAETTGELTEQDKILARYELIMEQTAKTAGDFADTQDSLANSQKTFNANLKDFQARIGAEAVPVLADLSSAGTDLIVVLDGITSALAFTEASFIEMVPVLAQVADAIGFVAVGLDFLSGPFKEAEARSKTWQLELEAQHRAQITADASARDLGESTGTAADEAETADRKYKDLGRTLEEDVAGGAEDAKDAILDFIDAQRAAINPAVRAVQSLKRYEDAIKANAEALMEFGEGSDEAEAAGQDLLVAFQDLIADAETFSQVTGVDIEDALFTIGRQAGLTTGQIQGIIERLREIDQIKVVADIELALRSTGSAADKALANKFLLGTTEPTPTPVSSGAPEVQLRRAHGGPVFPNQAHLVGERGPELFVPSHAGHIVPNITNNSDQNITFVTSGNVAQDAQVAAIMLSNRALVRGGLKGGAF